MTINRERFLKNFEQALRDQGLWRNTIHETCDAAEKRTGVSYAYFEQALHGRPVNRNIAELCSSLGVTTEDMLEKDLVST